MPDAEPEPPAPAIPAWLEPATLRAMGEAVNRALAWNRDARTAAEAAREVARAHLPAATMAMLNEAVAAVLPDPEGLAPAAPSWRGELLTDRVGGHRLDVAAAHRGRLSQRGWL